MTQQTNRPTSGTPVLRVGVLVMSYGTPAAPEQVEEYYTHIRRGRPPTEEQLADLRRRYDAIGGISPLRERTAAQTAAIAAGLEEISPGQFLIGRGDKHTAPFIEDGVEQLVDAGAELIVGLVLAPHFSRGSVGEYQGRATEVAFARGVPFIAIDQWWDLDGFIAHQAASLRDALGRMPERTKVVFTAHSLPERVLAGDPYPDELYRSAVAISERAGLRRWDQWGMAWQSAGRTPEPWRGPDILEVIDDLAATGRSDGPPRGIVVCAHGFVADHLEVRYDLDIEASARAAAHGLAFARTEPVGADPATMTQLAQRIAQRSGVS